MEVILLAGGFGTRLAHVVNTVPKPMAPVAGRPFLKYLLDSLLHQKVERCILAVGYKKESIIEAFGNSYHGMELGYSIEETALGTGGAIKQACDLCQSEDIAVLNGDTYFDVPLKELFQYHCTHKSEITVALKPLTKFNRYGAVYLSPSGTVEKMAEKEYCDSGLINGGIYIMNKNALNSCTQTRFSFETDILEQYVSSGKVCGYIKDSYFIDIGVPEDYVKANQDFPFKKAIFLDRDGTININTHYLYKPEELVFIEGVPQAIKQWNDAGYLVIVITNQAGVARGIYTEEDMHNLHAIMSERLWNEYGAKIDAWYYCPHHPESGVGKYLVKCDCRKPEPGMLERAIYEHRIDRFQSFMIGDKSWDVEAGNRASVQSLLFDGDIRPILEKTLITKG